MGRNSISRYLPIREHRNEVSDDIVGQRPAVARVRSLAPRLIRQHVGQQGRCHPRCFLRRVPTRVLQRVREDGDKPRIVRWFSCRISAFLVPGEEGFLRRVGASVRLNVRSGRAIQRTRPEANTLSA